MMQAQGLPFDALSREQLLPVALETMLVAQLDDRALMPVFATATKSPAAVNAISIDEWMGASPVYTGRMRRLMGIEGDGVDAIVKALQLDVGFPHQYFDVRFLVRDAHYGEFWLAHCGALTDVEPLGERAVINVCHTIEDPTFDATAYATNPRARMRPVHRPPRVPADRLPHCHWTIEIDPANEPVGPAKLTRTVAALPLAAVANAQAPENSTRGMTDYRGAVDLDFRFGKLSTATLAAVAREFQIQIHLLVSAADLAIREHVDLQTAREILTTQWIATAWVAGQRLARVLAVEGQGAAAVAEVLRLHTALPPGFTRQVEVVSDRVYVRLEPMSANLLDPEQPGWIGLLLRGSAAGVEAAAQAADPRATLSAVETRAGGIAIELRVDRGATPAQPPNEARLIRHSTATSWVFDTSEAKLGR